MFYSEEQEQEAMSRCATPQEACREYARNVGATMPEKEYILTHFDTWERNPFYTGKPGKHPEDDSDCYEEYLENIIDDNGTTELVKRSLAANPDNESNFDDMPF